MNKYDLHADKAYKMRKICVFQLGNIFMYRFNHVVVHSLMQLRLILFIL